MAWGLVSKVMLRTGLEHSWKAGWTWMNFDERWWTWSLWSPRGQPLGIRLPGSSQYASWNTLVSDSWVESLRLANMKKGQKKDKLDGDWTVTGQDSRILPQLMDDAAFACKEFRCSVSVGWVRRNKEMFKHVRIHKLETEMIFTDVLWAFAL